MSGSADTTAVRKAHRFDEARLDVWLQAHVSSYAGPLTVKQFTGGQSNPTYRLDTPGHSYVLRRKPMGKLLAGAHAVDREARVQQALATSGFPVPEVHALCTDDEIIGSWFYVMDCVEGRIFWDPALPAIARAERRRYFDAMNETIARLHAIDYRAIGLGDYGKTGNFLSRQIRRWSGQYIGDVEAGRDPHMDKLIDWLPDHVPAGDETCLTHGDFRIDNMIFHPTEPRVIAVLDWELSTLGHPLADFAYHLLMYRMPPGLLASLSGADLAVLDIPTETEYAAAYCRRSGRTSIPHADFYIVFNLFRLAAILHGIRGRIARGNAASVQAERTAAVMPLLTRLAWKIAENA